MTIKNAIVELLSKRELIMIEISAELQIPKERTMVYLNQLLKANKIKRITEKKPYKYTAVAGNGQYVLSKIREMIENGILRVYDESELTDEYKKVLEEL